MSSHWPDLLETAFTIMDRAASMGTDMADVTFGGGTALMLHMDHRDSHDIDLFVSNPESLTVLERVIRNMAEQCDLECTGDERSFISLDYGIGDIDFIYGELAGIRAIPDAPGYWQPAVRTELAGRPIWLETVPEIIGKKIYYRCTNLTPRDVFDIAAACGAGHPADIRRIVEHMPREAATAASIIEGFPAGCIRDAMSVYDVRPEFRPLLESAAETVVDMIDGKDSAWHLPGSARGKDDDDGSGGSMGGGPS